MVLRNRKRTPSLACEHAELISPRYPHTSTHARNTYTYTHACTQTLHPSGRRRTLCCACFFFSHGRCRVVDLLSGCWKVASAALWSSFTVILDSILSFFCINVARSLEMCVGNELLFVITTTNAQHYRLWCISCCQLSATTRVILGCVSATLLARFSGVFLHVQYVCKDRYANRVVLDQILYVATRNLIKFVAKSLSFLISRAVMDDLILLATPCIGESLELTRLSLRLI